MAGSATFPPLSWVVPDLIPEGMTLLVGGPKIGKSWLSLDIALAVASGGRALGSVRTGPAPRRCCCWRWRTATGGYRSAARELLAGDPIPPALDYLTRIEPGTVVDTIREWLDGLDPDAEPLVILDTLGQGDAAGRAGRVHLPARLPGGRLVEADHRRPPRHGSARAPPRPQGAVRRLRGRVSGTNGIAGAADTVIVLRPPAHRGPRTVQGHRPRRARTGVRRHRRRVVGGPSAVATWTPPPMPP